MKVHYKDCPGVWAEMVCDSVNPFTGTRISTAVVRLPRIVLAELNTHAALAKNSASSRAIPAATFRQRVLDDPYVPWRWPVNGKGMVPKEYAAPRAWRTKVAVLVWKGALGVASLAHRLLERLGVHKEITNRLLEPWMWTEVLVTATDWDGFFAQRCHEAAADGVRAAATVLRDLLDAHTPTETSLHLPYIQQGEQGAPMDLFMASARRCRRVSYLRQGVVVSLEEDAAAGAEGLRETPPHLSPYEHAAWALGTPTRSAKFRDWKSARHVYGEDWR